MTELRKNQPVQVCKYCGFTCKEGFKSQGIIPSVCKECESIEHQKFLNDPAWGDIGRGG